TGGTRSLNKPGKVQDAYVLKIPPAGGPFAYLIRSNGTVINSVDPAAGSGSSVGTALAVSPTGSVYVGGYSESLNFPTTSGSTRSLWTQASTQDAIFFVIQP